MHHVTKAMLIDFIDGKCDIKFNQLHWAYIMPLVINILIPQDWIHTQTHTCMHAYIKDKSNFKKSGCIDINLAASISIPAVYF